MLSLLTCSSQLLTRLGSAFYNSTYQLFCGPLQNDNTQFLEQRFVSSGLNWVRKAPNCGVS